MPQSIPVGFRKADWNGPSLTAAQYLPESGDNWHGAPQPGDIGTQGKNKISKPFLPILAPTLLEVTAAADFNIRSLL